MSFRLSFPSARTFTVVLATFTLYSATSSLQGSAGDLIVNGDANFVTQNGVTILELTTNGNSETGSAFSRFPVTFDSQYRFHTFFQFFFTNPGGIGAADGITFLIQTMSAHVLGGAGGALGVSGIAPSVGVNFVTFQNTWDLSDNTVGVITNGSYMGVDQHTPYGVTSCQPPTGVEGCMGNGDLWSVWVDYDGAFLSVAIADNSNIRPANLITYPIDIASILAGKPAYVGFTGATGNGLEDHYIASWIFEKVE